MNTLSRLVAVAAFGLLAAGTWVPTCLLAAEKTQQEMLSNAADGLSVNKPSAFPGYSLIAPMNATST